MADHPWLPPSAALFAEVAHARARALLERLSSIPQHRLGFRAAAWPLLLNAVPGLLREDSAWLLDAISRVDVFSALQALRNDRPDASRVERGLVTLWLALAGHPGLRSPLVLPGPFSQRVVDPHAPRLLALGDVRGLGATARGAVVLTRTGRAGVDAFVSSQLPAVGRTVLVDRQLDPPDAVVVARIEEALRATQPALPGGVLERVTVGPGDAAFGEASVSSEGDAADLVASAQAAFMRAVARMQPAFGAGGALVENGKRLQPIDVLARVCGNAIALPWRGNRSASLTAIAEDLDELRAMADPTPLGAELIAALSALAGDEPAQRRRALLVNVDADDFVYAFQFGRSVERRCVERGLRVDRIAINFSRGRDLAAELGPPIPPPIAEGIEVLMDSDEDETTASLALRRFASRRYDVVVANVRPRLFHDLLAAGFFASPSLLWDRHLHGGLRAEGDRRQVDPAALGRLPIEAWSLDRKTGPGLQRSLAEAGLKRGSGHVWPLDLEFFQPTVTHDANRRVFAGGENQRDWPLLIEAVRGLLLDVHLVSRQAPAPLPANVRVEARLPLCRFRDAMASASIFAIPLLADAAAGVTVIPMAMSLGVAIVATRTSWTEPLVRDNEHALLVAPGDVEAFRKAIVRLCDDSELRARLGANARKRVAEICDLEAFTRKMFATLS
jgi:hypothetical protein